jgi:hypothetical protein
MNAAIENPLPVKIGKEWSPETMDSHDVYMMDNLIPYYLHIDINYGLKMYAVYNDLDRSTDEYYVHFAGEGFSESLETVLKYLDAGTAKAYRITFVGTVLPKSFGIWQPMDTAPKGVWVLLDLDGQDWAIGCWYKSLDGGFWTGSEDDPAPFNLSPAHWMHLPMPPNVQPAK